VWEKCEVLLEWQGLLQEREVLEWTVEDDLFEDDLEVWFMNLEKTRELYTWTMMELGLRVAPSRHAFRCSCPNRDLHVVGG
jgi:hypothetical protein